MAQKPTEPDRPDRKRTKRDADEPASDSDGSSRSDARSKSGGKAKRRRRQEESRTGIFLGIAGGAALMLLLIYGLVRLLKTDPAPAPPGPVAQKGVIFGEPPDAGGVQPVAPGSVAAPADAPPELPPPAMWKTKPDPAPQPRKALPDTLRVPLGFAEPLFASADGPFFVDMPFSRGNERGKGKVIDLLSGKEVGVFADKSALHTTGGLARLSPDGQYVAAPVGRSTIEVWKIGADEPIAKLPIAGNAFWLDFRNAEELVAVSIDQRQSTLQMWKFVEGQERHKVVLPPQPGFSQGGLGTTAKISPGRNQVAVATKGELHMVDLESGTLVGTASRPTGLCDTFLFSSDGAELVAVYITKEERDVRSWLVTWDMTNGKMVRPPVALNLQNATGAPIPGPDGETLIFRNDYRFNAEKITGGQVIDRSTGTMIFELPDTPVRWEGKGHLLAYKTLIETGTGPLPNQKREVMVVAFDQAQYLAKAGGARGAVAQRPPAQKGDRKAIQSLKAEPAGWQVRLDKIAPAAPIALGELDVEEGDVVFARSAAEVSSIFMLSARQPIARTSVHWRRYDLATGKAIGEPVELWPWFKQDYSKTPSPSQPNGLAPAISADGKRLVLRDPAHESGGRIDVWEVGAGRVLGLLPYAGAAVEWQAWSGNDKLLTIGDGKLTGWEVPSGKALFEVAGEYGGKGTVAPDGRWVVVPSNGHLDVIDTATGACLGRLDCAGVTPQTWSKLSISPDGRRLAGLSWMEKRNRRLQTWDLETGKTRDVFPLPVGLPSSVHWYGERRLVVGGEIVDLDLRTAVAACELPQAPTRSIDDSPDGRLWCASGSLKADAYARATVDERPGTFYTGWRRRLLACPAPDPSVVGELPGAAPAKRTVVFRPGLEVAVEASCRDPRRAERMKAAMEQILHRDGFKIGPASGWKIVMKAEQFDNQLEFNGGTWPVPGVKGSVHLVGPDGAAGGGDHRCDITVTPSKYEKRRDREGKRVYDFGNQLAYRAFEEEFWEAWTTQLDRVPWPRAVMQWQGQYASLPAKIRLDAGR